MQNYVFMSPILEDWDKIYKELKKYYIPIDNESQYYLFNSNILPNPAQIESNWSEFEIAMHWRFTVLWAKEHGLIEIINQSNFKPQYFSSKIDISVFKDKNEKANALKSLLEKHYYLDSKAFSIPGQNSDIPYVIGSEYDAWRFPVATLIGVFNDPEKDELLELAKFCKEYMLVPMLLVDVYLEGGLNAPTFDYLKYTYGDYCLLAPNDLEYKNFVYQMIKTSLSLGCVELFTYFVPFDFFDLFIPWSYDCEWGMGDDPKSYLMDRIKSLCDSAETISINKEVSIKNEIIPMYFVSTNSEKQCYESKPVDVILPKGQEYIKWQTVQDDEEISYCIWVDDNLSDSSKLHFAMLK